MKFAFLGSLRPNSGDISEEEINLITIQLFASFLFVITTIISLVLIYDLYLKKTNRTPIFTDETAKKIDTMNRLVIMAIIVMLLLINIAYVDITKQKGENPTNAEIEVISAILTLIAGSLSLYVFLRRLNKEFNFSDIENMEV